MPAEPGDHAIAVALVLDLQHHALVGLVGACEWLGHDTVETCAFKSAKPIRRGFHVARGWGQMQRWSGRGEKGFQFATSAFKRYTAQIAIVPAQQIEEDDGGGNLLREKLHARSRGMNSE